MEGELQGQGKKRQEQSEGSEIVEIGSAAHCSIGDGERRSDSGYILEVRLMGITDE